MKLFQNKMTALRNVVVAATMIVATQLLRSLM